MKKMMIGICRGFLSSKMHATRVVMDHMLDVEITMGVKGMVAIVIGCHLFSAASP